MSDQVETIPAIITTPNKKYNTVWDGMSQGEMRHPDHRHEFTEPEFKEFCKRHGALYGYSVSFCGIGPEAASIGQPSLMGVFKNAHRNS